jgi:uncharacterized DUF497 family protein
MYAFRWNTWNIDHIAEHGVVPEDAEHVVNHSRPPWPQKIGDERWRVWGQTGNGTFLQVIHGLVRMTWSL